jgi:PAS domain S-box-containing protein
MRIAFKLKEKFILVIVSAIFLAISLATYLNTADFIRLYKETVTEKTSLQLLRLKTVIDDVLMFSLGDETSQSVNWECQNMVAHTPYALYCLVVDKGGTVYYQNLSKEAGSLSIDVIVKTVLQSEKQVHYYTSPSGAKIYDFSLAFYGKPAGKRTNLAIHLGVKSEIIDKQVFYLIKRNTSLGIILIIIASIIAFFITQQIFLKPIRKLTGGISKFGRGDLTSRVKLKSADEIAELATSFNTMAESIVGYINERKKSEEEVRTAYNQEQEIKQRLSDIFDFLPDATFVIDVQGKVIAWNKACETMTGIKAADMIGKGNYEYALPFYNERRPILIDLVLLPRKEIESKYSTITHEGDAYIAETSVPHLYAGKGAYVLGKAHSLLDVEGKIVGAIESIRDITVLKKSQEELKTAYEQLQATQAQLVQSSKMASIGLLAGGVAHEINNPLTGVLNNVQLLQMMSERKDTVMDQAELKNMLNVIEEAAIRCKKITQALLDFSHTSKGSFCKVSLNDIIDQVVVLIEHELVLQNITITRELEPNLHPIQGDTQLLQQVVFDIITNARWAIKKKTAKESGNINIRTTYDSQEKMSCVFITDNGIGIAKENLNRIFEPFFTTKDVGEGTGLGLSIVYNIIRAHQGTIELESELGKGTTFKISFLAS